MQRGQKCILADETATNQFLRLGPQCLILCHFFWLGYKYFIYLFFTYFGLECSMLEVEECFFCILDCKIVT